MRVFTLSNLIINDGRTDKASYRVACPQLKKGTINHKKEEEKKEEEKKNEIQDPGVPGVSWKT